MNDIYISALIGVFMLGALQGLAYMAGLADLEIGADGADDINGGFDDPNISAIQSVNIDEPAIEAEIEAATSAADFGDLLGWRGVPFMIWLIFFLTGFGSAGMLVDIVFPLLSLPLAIIGGIALARFFSALFRRFVPKIETSAINISHMRRARGVVTDGVMTSSRAARVRIHDRFGGMHDIMARSASHHDTINAGTDVLVIGQFDPETMQRRFLAVAISE